MIDLFDVPNIQILIIIFKWSKFLIILFYSWFKLLLEFLLYLFYNTIFFMSNLVIILKVLLHREFSSFLPWILVFSSFYDQFQLLFLQLLSASQNNPQWLSQFELYSFFWSYLVHQQNFVFHAKVFQLWFLMNYFQQLKYYSDYGRFQFEFRFH